MFKYELDQLVYYLKDNKLHSAPVLSRSITENLREDYDTIFKQLGDSRRVYATCHGIINEEELFESKKALAEFIMK